MEPHDFSNSQIPFDTIPHANEVSFQPLESNYMVVNIIGVLMSFAVIFAILIAVIYLKWISFFPSTYNYMIYLIVGLLAVFSLFSAIFGFKNKGYAVRQKDIIYRSGWLRKNWIHVPYSRTQHSEVSQGILDRLFGLSKLKIYTAGGSKSDMLIPGLRLEEAQRLKQFVLTKINNDYGEEE